MVNARDEVLDGSPAKSSRWERPPELVRLEIASWEHASRVPGSWGKAHRVIDLQRLLPHELTAPIYVRLARAEALFQRRTEPLPPLKERLARDFLDGSISAVPGADTTGSDTDWLSLEGELRSISGGGLRLGDVVPEWDQKLAAELGVDAEGITRSIVDFAPQGLPRERFSLWYGYKLHVIRLPGTLLSPPFLTHGALLMGCSGPEVQPSRLREFCDDAFR